MLPRENSKKIEKSFILGFNTNTRNNLIYNKIECYFIYTINNKIVVEFLEASRFQIILEEHLDEISVINFFTTYIIIHNSALP